VFDAAIALHQRVRARDAGSIVAAAAAIRAAFEAGGKLLVFGNGGSAPTRSTWRRRWSAGFSASGRRCRRWRSRPIRVC
jgi:hypothetical protein